MCGPHGACTAPCRADGDCQGLAAQVCIEGLCGVPCSPDEANACGASGMASARCVTVQGHSVCGYATMRDLEKQIEEVQR